MINSTSNQSLLEEIVSTSQATEPWASHLLNMRYILIHTKRSWMRILERNSVVIIETSFFMSKMDIKMRGSWTSISQRLHPRPKCLTCLFSLLRCSTAQSTKTRETLWGVCPPWGWRISSRKTKREARLLGWTNLPKWGRNILRRHLRSRWSRNCRLRNLNQPNPLSTPLR